MRHIGNVQVSGSFKQQGSDDNHFLGNLSISGSTIFSNGSTKFGDDATDSHQFTGSIFGTDMRVDKVTYSTPTNYIQTGSYNDGFGTYSGLEIRGNSSVTFNVNGFDGASLYYDGFGYTFDIDDSVTFSETSTLSLKTNIQDLPQSYLDNFDSLRPVKYDRIDIEKTNIGFIAEEVNLLFSDLVTKYPDGSAKGIEYIRFIPVVVQALLDARQRISDLEAQLSGSL